MTLRLREKAPDRLRSSVQTMVRRFPGRRADWGSLRRLTPLSHHYGYDRGAPVDRRYIEAFMARNASAIAGDVLEVRDPLYTRQYGDLSANAHVVDIDSSNRQATIVADLVEPGSIPTDAYDCVILTQVLHLLEDPGLALNNLWNALRPRGVLLVTAPCISRIVKEAPIDDRWRWTPMGLLHLLRASCPGGAARSEGAGNLLTCVAFLYGIAAEELTQDELDHSDIGHPLVAMGRVDRPMTAL